MEECSLAFLGSALQGTYISPSKEVGKMIFLLGGDMLVPRRAILVLGYLVANYQSFVC